MIYNEQENVPFDDTIIRGVDKIVDGLYFRNDSKYTGSLTTTQYFDEYRAVFIKLPRRTGKTTYLKKLYSHLVYKGHNPVIVTSKFSEKQINYESKFETKTVQELIKRQTLLGRQTYYDIFLCDEVKPQEAKEVLAHLCQYTHNFSSKVNFVLGLYT